MGAFIVDDTTSPTALKLNIPKTSGDGQGKSKEVLLADHIVASLKKRTGCFDTLNKLKAMLAEDEVKYTAGHLPVALELLVDQERLEWPETSGTKPRPGRLTEAATSSVAPN
jgi:hypothetical protein